MAAYGLSFKESPVYLFTSESVTEGHPDKVCDQISDAILDAYLAQDPYSRVACETCASVEHILVMGEISSRGTVDIESLVRKTLRDIGYVTPEKGIGADSCVVQLAIQNQSKEITSAVNPEADPSSIGAGDQGMMVGFACKEKFKGEVIETQLMPLSLYLSHKLTMQMAKVRKEGIVSYLRPDGKSQVTIEYSYGSPNSVHTVVVSPQTDPGIKPDQLFYDMMEHVIKPVIPEMLLNENIRYFVNPSGSFVLGGPAADSGLTGRKILVDTYGAIARHGGGAFSGKDPTKVDRSGAYAARYVAKNLVAAGVADRIEVQISYAIGVAEPISIAVESFGTSKIPHQNLDQLVRKYFDLRPGAIIRDLNLRKPIFQKSASYGHFGRTDVQFPWEETDCAEEIANDPLASIS
jgi:S-adenosylmethionine synthetase